MPGEVTELLDVVNLVDRLARIETKLDQVLALETRVLKLEATTAKLFGLAIAIPTVLTIVLQLLK